MTVADTQARLAQVNAALKIGDAYRARGEDGNTAIVSYLVMRRRELEAALGGKK